MTTATVRARRALLAARAVAAGHGVAAGGARVLRDGVNVVVHLAPAPVVARVATLTPLLRPAPLRSFAREVALAGALAAVGAPVVPPSDVLPLHGDAHPGNLLATRDGWLWTDLEDTCAGPRAWDLACLRTTSRLDGRAALDAFPEAPSDAELAPWLELRRLHAAAWTLVAAAGRLDRGPAGDRPGARRYSGASGSAGSR